MRDELARDPARDRRHRRPRHARPRGGVLARRPDRADAGRRRSSRRGRRRSCTLAPPTRWAAEFVGAGNFLPGTLANGVVETRVGRFPAQRSERRRRRRGADPARSCSSSSPTRPATARWSAASSAGTTSSTASSSTASSSSRSVRRTRRCRSARASHVRPHDVTRHRLLLICKVRLLHRCKATLTKEERDEEAGRYCSRRSRLRLRDARRAAESGPRPRRSRAASSSSTRAGRRSSSSRSSSASRRRRGSTSTSATATAPSSRRRSPRKATTRPADVFFAQDPGLARRGRRRSSRELPDGDARPRRRREFRDADGRWVGTSGRARVLVFNTDELTEDEVPDSVFDLTDPKWKGKVGIAADERVLPGLRDRDAARRRRRARRRQWLEALKANDPKFYEKNTPVVEAVAVGRDRASGS